MGDVHMHADDSNCVSLIASIEPTLVIPTRRTQAWKFTNIWARALVPSCFDLSVRGVRLSTDATGLDSGDDEPPQRRVR